VKKKAIQAVIDKIRQDTSWGTTRRYGSCIRNVFQEAIADELIKENPADKLNYGKKDRKKAYVLSKKQSVDLPNELYEFSSRLSAMVVVEIDGGLRPGEVCALRAEDLDMPEEGSWAIWVRRSIARNGEVVAVKDDEERLVFLTDDALEAIAQNLKGRRKGFVFQTDVGKPLKPDYLGTQLRRFRKHLQRKLEKAAEGSNEPIPAVPPFTHRGFRRTFATRGVRAGDLKSTQHLLGHASADMTADIYAEPEEGAMRKTVEAIQASVGYRGLFKSK
jgi:integrase